MFLTYLKACLSDFILSTMFLIFMSHFVKRSCQILSMIWIYYSKLFMVNKLYIKVKLVCILYAKANTIAGSRKLTTKLSEIFGQVLIIISFHWDIEQNMLKLKILKHLLDKMCLKLQVFSIIVKKMAWPFKLGTHKGVISYFFFLSFFFTI